MQYFQNVHKEYLQFATFSKITFDFIGQHLFLVEHDCDIFLIDFMKKKKDFKIVLCLNGPSFLEVNRSHDLVHHVQ